MSFGIQNNEAMATIKAWVPVLNAIADKSSFFSGVYQWKDYVPVFSASGAMTFTPTVYEASYIRIGPLVIAHVLAEGATGGVASNNLYFSLPIKTTKIFFPGFGLVSDGAGTNRAAMVQNDTDERVSCRKYDDSNFGIGNNRLVNVTVLYFAEEV